MKKTFKILKLFCVGMLILGTLTGCVINNFITENDKENNDVILEENTSTNTKGNCTVLECIKKINPENTVEQINNIIGFKGELIDEKYNIYYWELSEETGVKMAYYSSTKGTVSIDYNKESLANRKVDFSRYSELKSKINEGISYNDFISYIGGVEGTIIEKTSYSIKYIWVSSNGSYLNGTFSNSSGQCTVASGMIK